MEMGRSSFDMSRPSHLLSHRPQAVPVWKAYLVVFGSACLIAVVLVLTLSRGPQDEAPGTVIAAAVYNAECSAHSGCQGQQGSCCPTAQGVLMGCCDAIDMAAHLEPFKGMCYTPAPARTQFNFPSDDYMASWSEPLWNSGGSWRDDLGKIHQMGATMIRLYGNDPRLEHAGFLDRAAELGLGVIVALSAFPYTQDKDGACGIALPYNCFNEIQLQYEMMLSKGFTYLRSDGKRQYHSAIKAILLMNEPELNILYNGQINGEAISKGYYAKVLISAFDGALAAEQDMGIVPSKAGTLPPFTVTHSFAQCEHCESNRRGNKAGGTPVGRTSAVAYMYDFALGCLDPESYGYTSSSQIDLRYGLQNRFALGFNTQDSADVVCSQVLTHLANSPFKNAPVFAGEYKPTWQSLPASKMTDFKDDLALMANSFAGADACRDNKALRGVSVFEFQTSYWKGGEGGGELVFGIYELGNKTLGKTISAENTGWAEYSIDCLHQKRNDAGESWVAAVAEVYGGTAPDDSDCPCGCPDWRPPLLKAKAAHTTVV